MEKNTYYAIFGGLLIILISGLIFSYGMFITGHIISTTYDDEFPVIRNQTLSEVKNVNSTYEKIQIINNNCGKMSFGKQTCKDDLETEIFIDLNK